jgi:Helix-turn-helix domain
MQGERAFLRVREAAPMLGISASAAYVLANIWLDSGGQTGLPAVRLGRSILIPRAARLPPGASLLTGGRRWPPSGRRWGRSC